MSSVVTESHAGVLTITLNRPAVRNALNSDMLIELTALLRQVAHDSDIEVVILTGCDPAFCAGLDLGELSADPARLIAIATDPATNPFLALRELPQPAIGAVNGPAITGGLELALACDFLVAGPSARFGDTHAKVGVLPAQGAPALLSAVVGSAVAREMSLTGNPIDAERALRVGLVNHLVEHDDLLPFTRTLAADIQGCDSRAVREVKRSYVEGTMGTRAQWLDLEARASAAWHLNAGGGSSTTR